ncbi:hypothetical protein CEXT_349301 [Caerostris extrusa]|uniref:Uncharacterized protein n=1 Tax=Caerostris extrusa TaxID=172846 RepID=A0AAV4QIB0_CAEEX|nr:hypothetical protein CEXT_349301 [Caerostris extrusa]
MQIYHREDNIILELLPLEFNTRERTELLALSIGISIPLTSVHVIPKSQSWVTMPAGSFINFAKSFWDRFIERACQVDKLY